jgi:3-oxoacyl-[acyl-carrier protein] reductase
VSDPDQEQPSPGDLRDRCAVVTGAANGIGLAIAQRLWRAGASVIAVDKDGPGLKEHFGADGREEQYAWVEHDLAEPDEAFSDSPTNGDALADKILTLAEERGFELPTLIVNNVGIETPHNFRNLPPTTFDAVYRVNVRTPWRLTQRLVDALLTPDDNAKDARPPTPAAILFISSLHDRVPSGRPHYSASKAAVSMLTRDLAAELGTHGIRVNAISPGWIRTDPDPNSPEQQAKRLALLPRVPLDRPGTPDDVAKLALVLLSDTCSCYVTGVNLPVDGGLALDTWIPPRGMPWDEWPSASEAARVSEQEPSPVGLKGRCAVVTGAARGIGLAIAQHLQDAGAYVIAVDQDEQSLKEHFGSTPGCDWIAYDLALGDEHFSGDGTGTNGAALATKVLALAKERKAEIPSLIVNNAAASTPHGFLDVEPADHDDVYRVIVRSPWYLTQRLVDEFLKARANHPEVTPERAAVLFVGSIHEGVPARRPHYSASKAALPQLVRESAFELGEQGIRVNAISPGWIRTDSDPNSPEQQAKERVLVPRIPLGRPGTPDDVARVALLLLSDAWSDYVTGVNLPVDGGLSLNMCAPPGVPCDTWR